MQNLSPRAKKTAHSVLILSEVAPSFDLLKLCGSPSEKAADPRNGSALHASQGAERAPVRVSRGRLNAK